MAHGADWTLEFVCVHRRHLSVVIKVVKGFVNTVKILEVSEDQELALSKTLGLVDGQGSGIVFIARLCKTAECKQQYH